MLVRAAGMKHDRGMFIRVPRVANRAAVAATLQYFHALRNRIFSHLVQEFEAVWSSGVCRVPTEPVLLLSRHRIDRR
jgi:hypothetical protein